MKLLLQTTGDTKTKTNKLQSANPSVSCIVQHKKSTLTLNLLELWCKLKTKRESAAQTEGSKAGGKDSSGFPGARGEEVTTPTGGSHWKHQETVGFPRARATGVIGEHFLSPWLQETGQGCLFFFRASRRRARVQAERVRQRGVWLALCKTRFVGSVGKSSLQFSSFCSFSILNICTLKKWRLFVTFVVFVKSVNEITHVHTVASCQG